MGRFTSNLHMHVYDRHKRFYLFIFLAVDDFRLVLLFRCESFKSEDACFSCITSEEQETIFDISYFQHIFSYIFICISISKLPVHIVLFIVCGRVCHYCTGFKSVSVIRTTKCNQPDQGILYLCSF